MNRTTKYTEQLLYYLDRDEDFTAMMDWIEEQPDLDQSDILRELKTIFIERNEKTGERDWLEKAKLLEGMIDEFEDSILDDKLTKALFITEMQRVLSDTVKVKEFLSFTRNVLIKSILTNPDDNEVMWDFVHKTIKAEKESGLYDPENWSAIL
jgi:hypothetical protein